MGRCLAVKDITGYEQGINSLLCNNHNQPIKEKGKFLITLFAVQLMTKMPV